MLSFFILVFRCCPFLFLYFDAVLFYSYLFFLSVFFPAFLYLGGGGGGEARAGVFCLLVLFFVDIIELALSILKKGGGCLLVFFCFCFCFCFLSFKEMFSSLHSFASHLSPCFYFPPPSLLLPSPVSSPISMLLFI